MSKQVWFEYKIEVPVTASCHRRDDGSVSVDTVCVPDEDRLYKMVDENAKGIKAMAEVVAK